MTAMLSQLYVLKPLNKGEKTVLHCHGIIVANLVLGRQFPRVFFHPSCNNRLGRTDDERISFTLLPLRNFDALVVVTIAVGDRVREMCIRDRICSVAILYA